MPKGSFSKPSLSELAYEFAVPELRFGSVPTVPIISSSSSVPPLPMAMPAPIVMKHLGEIYVLYGSAYYDKESRTEMSKSDLEKCFLVLRNRKGCMEWESLPAPPAVYRPASCHNVVYFGAIGSRINVMVGRKMCCYDVNERKWEEHSSHLSCSKVGSLTLSSLSVPITDTEGRPCYVVVYAVHFDQAEHRIEAALADGDGEL
ncbi:hypothetical protein LINGRAHAP2_LOCUS26810 [Linum grandiflorum]